MYAYNGLANITRNHLTTNMQTNRFQQQHMIENNAGQPFGLGAEPTEYHQARHTASQPAADLTPRNIPRNGQNNSQPSSPDAKQQVDILLAQLRQLHSLGLSGDDLRITQLRNAIFTIQKRAYAYAKQLQQHGVAINDHRMKAARQLVWYVKDHLSQLANNHDIISGSSGVSGMIERQQQTPVNVRNAQAQMLDQRINSNSPVPSPEALLRLQQATETKRAAVSMLGTGTPIGQQSPSEHSWLRPPHNQSPRSQLPPGQAQIANAEMNESSRRRSLAGQMSVQRPQSRYVSLSPSTAYQYYYASRPTPASPSPRGTDGTYRLPSFTPSPSRTTSSARLSHQSSSPTPTCTATKPLAVPSNTQVRDGAISNATTTSDRSQLLKPVMGPEQTGLRMLRHAQAIAVQAAKAKLPPPRLPAPGSVLGKHPRAVEETAQDPNLNIQTQQPAPKKQMVEQQDDSAQQRQLIGPLRTGTTKPRPQQILQPGANARAAPRTTSALFPTDPITEQQRALSPPQPVVKLIRPGAAQYGEPVPSDYAEIDPRELEAETTAEIEHVWTALAKTRQQYFEITGNIINRGDLQLSLGYNRAYFKICSMLQNWLFTYAAPGVDREQHSRDLATARAIAAQSDTEDEGKSASENDLEPYATFPRDAPPGYAQVGTRRKGSVTQGGQRRSKEEEQAEAHREQQRNSMLDSWFQGQHELVLDPKEVLFRLERWTGGIKHYVFAPNIRQQARVWTNGAWSS